MRFNAATAKTMTEKCATIIRRSDLRGFFVYFLLVAFLAGLLFVVWPAGDIADATKGRQLAFAVTVSSLFVALLFGLPAIMSFVPDRRRILALAELLRDVECPHCNSLYDPTVVEQTAFGTTPLCGGDPENEDLRPRWMVQCGGCGQWTGFGDDAERIEGGMVAVPRSSMDPADPT